jgi:hypothetical protein
MGSPQPQTVPLDRWLADEVDEAGGHALQSASAGEALRPKRVCNSCYQFAPEEVAARRRRGDDGMVGLASSAPPPQLPGDGGPEPTTAEAFERAQAAEGEDFDAL